MARHRSLALPAVAVLLSVLAACASASLSDGERMLEENRFTEAARALRDIADRESADDAERARAARGLAVAYLAREEGVEAVKACATAIILDPGHPGNTGLVKTIERELGLSGVPEGWDDTLGLIVEAADPYPILRDYVVDIEIATARFHGDSEARWEATAKYGCVRDYMIAGPFPNTGGSGIYERYPPEDEIDLGAEYTDHLGRRFGWESWSQGGRCYIDLDLFLGDEPNAVAYALTHVRADERIEGTAHLFGGGAFRLWVNGSPVLRERTTRMGGRSLYEAPVVLHEGWNRVLLKAASETEPMDFAFRFRDAEDRPLYLDCDPDPGVYDKTGAPGSPVVPGMPTYTFESLPESNWLKQWRGSLDDAPLCDWYFYIFFIMGHGFEIESEAAIESCAERFPESAVLDGVRAELLVAQDRSGEAASIRRELAEESPEYTPASTFVVGEALEQGDIDEAWNEASTALSRNPNNVTLRAMHGALLAGRGSVNEGITEMEAAFEEEPGNVAARTLYLMILRALRGESEYEAALERALEARPDDPSLARQAASAAFEREDYDAAVEHLRDAERAGDRADVVSLSVGMVLEEAGKLEEALETYEEGLAVAPRSVTLHPIGMSSRSLKLAIDLRAFRTTAF